MNQPQIDEEKNRLLQNAVSAMERFKKVFYKEAEPTSPAEVRLADRLELELHISDTREGFDSGNNTGKRYRTRYLEAQNIDTNHFDSHCVVPVSLDDDCKLAGMRRATVTQAKDVSGWRDGRGYARRQITQTEFKSIVERVL